jgi:hypothetical protein
MKNNIILAISFFTLLVPSVDVASGESLKSPFKHQMVVTETPAHTVRSFLYWYRKNIKRLNNIQLVDQTQSPAKPYSVNKNNVAIYISELRKSGFLGEKFLASVEYYISICDANLIKIKQTEGPPEGFDMDMVLLMQDYESDFLHLDKAKAIYLTKTKIEFTFASENFLVFRLAQTKGKWFIQSIE